MLERENKKETKSYKLINYILQWIHGNVFFVRSEADNYVSVTKSHKGHLKPTDFLFTWFLGFLCENVTKDVSSKFWLRHIWCVCIIPTFVCVFGR